MPDDSECVSAAVTADHSCLLSRAPARSPITGDRTYIKFLYTSVQHHGDSDLLEGDTAQTPPPPPLLSLSPLYSSLPFLVRRAPFSEVRRLPAPSESDAAAAKSEADQEVCGAWWVQEHARGASRSMGAQQRLTPPLLQCAKCKAAAYCSKECKVPPPPNTHMQRAAPEPSQPVQEQQDGRSMRTPMDDSIIIMLLLVTRSGTHRRAGCSRASRWCTRLTTGLY
jgi:hypothetical protein